MAAGCMRARLLSTRTTNKGAVKNTAQLNISQFVVRASSHLLFGRVRVRCSYAGRTVPYEREFTCANCARRALRFSTLPSDDNRQRHSSSWLLAGSRAPNPMPKWYLPISPLPTHHGGPKPNPHRHRCCRCPRRHHSSSHRRS